MRRGGNIIISSKAIKGLSEKCAEIASLQKWSAVSYAGKRQEAFSATLLFPQVSQHTGRLQESLTHRFSSVPLKTDLKRHRMDRINWPHHKNSKGLPDSSLFYFNLLKACLDCIHLIWVGLFSKINCLYMHTLTHVEFLFCKPQRGFWFFFWFTRKECEQVRCTLGFGWLRSHSMRLHGNQMAAENVSFIKRSNNNKINRCMKF